MNIHNFTILKCNEICKVKLTLCYKHKYDVSCVVFTG